MTPTFRLTASVAALALLGACVQPMDRDPDLRGQMGGGFDTSNAAFDAIGGRPQPDDRGIISYPTYQVAIAKDGDLVTDVANRIGLPAAELARFNGMRADDPLRRGEVLALPRRVTEPSPATGADQTGPIRPASEVDVTTLASNAIDGATETPRTDSAQSGGVEPIRHRVERGETVFTIARLYGVTPRVLAQWNALDENFTLREGQYLLVPVVDRNAARSADPGVTQPGNGSPTPTPPSASTPLPDADTVAASAEPEPDPEPVADIGQDSVDAPSAAMASPVSGSIARAFNRDRNPGVVYSASAGAPVRAAASGSVIAVSEGADGVRFVLVRHPDELVTAYRMVDDVQVATGDAVSRGQVLGSVAANDTPALDFRVYRGTTPLDPMDYLP